jgi:site-specific recombinase XerD
VRVDDLDDHVELRVHRKGAREQVLSLGAKTIQALDRYMREARPPAAHDAARLRARSTVRLAGAGEERFSRPSTSLRVYGGEESDNS